MVAGNDAIWSSEPTSFHPRGIGLESPRASAAESDKIIGYRRLRNAMRGHWQNLSSSYLRKLPEGDPSLSKIEIVRIVPERQMHTIGIMI
jgi:hypothetical protein